MPRGRKRPPQDSIDSILLAISRRDNIDPDTLAHYLDRLDEEWTEGAREKVLHLLRTHDAAAHAAGECFASAGGRRAGPGCFAGCAGIAATDVTRTTGCTAGRRRSPRAAVSDS